MGGIMLKMSFMDKILTMFDIIPKIIYFLCTIFLSVIDVLQCVVRKLAGLDRYWMEVVDPSTGAGTGQFNQISQQDPLTEFIYGILGYGESAAAYKGLNTVFWSLAIFAVVCLCVTSMIAIIKSHYNEDANATNPWKYIYTAIKAVFTFAIVPFAVVIGMQLASWVLRTVDSITAGSAGSGEMRYMYGSGYTEVFEGEDFSGNGVLYYSNYDFFGLGSVTTSTPFSGTIFKACTYNANRAREDSSFANAVRDLKDNNGNQIFGGEAYAYEAIEFAFANNLQLKNGLSRGKVTSVLVDGDDGALVNYWGATDIIIPLINAKSFSKFRVGLVWMFYNLWSYDFIVAMVGGVTVVGIMLSVIIGLMSRLMKGAILFLIYPALLGIAPLDNFKAFKSWTQQFMQQVMMAFGAIIGMNLTLLVLPYAQTIQWFDPSWGWILNNLMNTIVMITGLMMMKDIISMISQFVGGADANAAGGALKAEVGKGIATGAKFAGKAGLAIGKGTAKAVGGAAKIGRNVLKSKINAGQRRKHGGAQGHVQHLQGKQAAAEGAAATARNELATEVGGSGAYAKYSAGRRNDLHNSSAYKKAKSKERKKMDADLDAELNSDDSKLAFYSTHKNSFGKNVDEKAKALTKAEAKAARAKQHTNQVAQEEGYTINEDGEVNFEKRKNWAQRNLAPIGKGLADPVVHASKAVWNATSGGLNEGYTSKYGTDMKYHYYDKDGNEVTRAEATKFSNMFTKMWNDPVGLGQAGKHIADGFLKGLGDISSGVGLDKLQSGMADIFKNGFTFQGGVFDMKDPKLEGDKLTSSEHEKTRLAQQKASEDSTSKIVKAIEELKKSSGGESSGIAKAATDMKAAAGDLKKIAETLKGMKPGSGS